MTEEVETLLYEPRTADRAARRAALRRNPDARHHGQPPGRRGRSLPGTVRWLAEHAVAVTGPPLIRHLVIDMAAELEIELAVPVEVKVGDSGRIVPGILPAGRYAVLR